MHRAAGTKWNFGMIRAGKAVKGAKVLILGLTFKENVGDIRNTKVVDIISELAEYGVESFVYDLYASVEEVLHEYGEIIGAPGHAPGVLVSSLEKLAAVDAVARARCILRRPSICHVV